MKLIILGSGTCVPSLKRSAPSTYLKIGDKQILIDCGSGTLTQLEKAELSYKTIDIVCISHYHPDHISDLNALIQALKYTPGFNRKKDLILIGPVGFKKFYKTYLAPISGNSHVGTYKIIIKEISGKLSFDKFTIESYKTNHNIDSIAYKFSEKEKILVISGDTDFDEGLIKFSKNSNVLILDCSFPDKQKNSGHLIPSECGRIAKEANVKKLILSHLYPISPKETRLDETKKIFLKTVLAKDLMICNI